MASTQPDLEKQTLKLDSQISNTTAASQNPLTPGVKKSLIMSSPSLLLIKVKRSLAPSCTTKVIVNVLTFLYRKNVIHSRANVYKHFLEWPKEKTVNPEEEKWIEITRDLTEHYKAIKMYDKFINSLDNAKNLLEGVGMGSYKAVINSINSNPNSSEATRHSITTFQPKEDWDTAQYFSSASATPPFEKSHTPRVKSTQLEAATEKRREMWQKFLSRFYMAIFSGCALIVPMLIMTLHRSKAASLATASSFVIAVAVLLGWLMQDGEPRDVIAATAAYAAVLVVLLASVAMADDADALISSSGSYV